jgi:hypothetical protein
LIEEEHKKLIKEYKESKNLLEEALDKKISGNKWE